MIIDAHHHVWRLARGDYGWLTPAAGRLYRDFHLADYAAAAPFVDASILVQAAPSDAETDYLLSLAEGSDRVAGVVGWVDLASPTALGRLAGLARRPKFLGVRPMLQDLADADWIARDDLTPALEALVGLGLAFDALVRLPNLTGLVRMSARHPALRVVIDHAAKPDLAGGGFDAWAEALAPFGDLPQVVCKLSGLPSEAGPDWNAKTLARWIERLMQMFGPERLMWGSDWPVLTEVASLTAWYQAVHEVVEPQGEAALADVFGGAARRFYHLQQGATGWVRE